MDKIPVGILGATGAVGQKLIALLAGHPWFEVCEVVASDRGVGQEYGAYVSWHEAQVIPDRVTKLRLKSCKEPLNSRLLFSGLTAEVAGPVEAAYAAAGHIVVSNAKNHRLEDKVPLIIPEINSEHLELITPETRKKGYIVTNPNCVVVMLALALAPIYRHFGLEKVMVTTMQAISGAGYPGVASLDIIGNVLPHIIGEEEKIAPETKKILGELKNNAVKFADFKLSASCNRVPVREGHLLNVALQCGRRVTRAEMIAAWREFGSQKLALPSAPREVVRFIDQPLRPQPSLDLMAGNGMTVTIGNLRACEVLDWKFAVFGHNTIRGAAGAAILNAEALVAAGWLGERR